MSNAVRDEMIRLLPRLRAFARALAVAPDQADDLVQQTCEKGLRNLGGFTPGTRLDSWLFRIMRNTWIDGIRARPPVSPLDEVEAVAELEGADGRIVTDAHLRLAEVRRAMERLPEEQRAVLMLVCVEGMRYREVAELLGIPQGTVMSRLARGRVALAEALGMVPASAGARRGAAR